MKRTPLLKRSRSRDRGWVALSLGIVAALCGVVGLLQLAESHRAPREERPALAPRTLPVPDPAVLLGSSAYVDRGCAACHEAAPTDAGETKVSVALPLVGRAFSWESDRLAQHLSRESRKDRPTPEDKPPDYDLPALVEFTEALRDRRADFTLTPPEVRRGGAVIEREDCRDCHRILGRGGRRGPALGGLSGKRDRAWLVEHFLDPKKHTPDSKMPAFRELPKDELSAMSAYLLALP